MTTYSQLKEIHNFAQEQGIDFKDFFNDTFNGSTIDGDFDKFKNLVESINDGLITFKQFDRENFIENEGKFYFVMDILEIKTRTFR